MPEGRTLSRPEESTRSPITMVKARVIAGTNQEDEILKKKFIQPIEPLEESLI